MNRIKEEFEGEELTRAGFGEKLGKTYNWANSFARIIRLQMFDFPYKIAFDQRVEPKDL